jgi:hypothetical protein
MASRTAWFYGFATLALIAGCTASAKPSDDDDGGSSGTTTSSGGNTSCEGACTKQATAMCPNAPDQATCVSDCQEGRAMSPTACQDEFDTMIACGVTTGTITCDAEGQPEVQGCDEQFGAYLTCVQATTSSSSASGTSSSSSSGTGGGPGSCYAGQGACDPTVPGSCAAGEACDVDGGTMMFACFPPPNDAAEGQACNNMSGPFCMHGLACDAMVCRKYCCDNADCTTGTCTTVGMSGSITQKVCK